MKCRDLKDIFMLEKEELMELDKLLHPSKTKYTVIDDLVNIKAHHRACHILFHWHVILGQGYHETEKKKPTAVKRLFLILSNTDMDSNMDD